MRFLTSVPDQLETILEAIDTGVTVQDTDGRLIYANLAAARLTGYPSPEALLEPPIFTVTERFDMMDEHGVPLTSDRLPGRRVLRGEEVPEMIIRFRVRDTGEERWSAVKATPIVNDQGVVDRVISVFRDVTAQRTAEEVQHRLAFLAEASNVLASSLDYQSTLAAVAQLVVPRLADWCGVHVVEDDGTVQQLAVAHVDPAKMQMARKLAERYPYDPEAPIGLPHVLRTRQPELIHEISDSLRGMAAGDQELLNIVHQLDLRSSMIVPLLARGRVLGAITFVVGESGRRYGSGDLRLAEDLANRAALAVDNARLYRESAKTAAEQAAILEHMTDGVMLANQSGEVTYLNQAARELFAFEGVGGSIETFVQMARPLTAAGQDVDVEATTLRRALRGETILNAERHLHRPAGHEVIILVSASPVVVEDGTMLGAVAVFRDVTAEIDLERQKDAFLSAAAHDLKNPLTSIKGSAQMLRYLVGRGDTERLVRGLERIDEAATRMARLVNELLDVSRLQMGGSLDLNLIEGDLVALLQRVADEYQRGTDRHRISVQTAVPELPGSWDMDRLERVFANLLSNAIKYSPGGGEVAINVREDRGEHGPEAVVTVGDRGLGIAANDLPRIFERFFRGRNARSEISGTGIGLAGVKHIVERHQGSITVESREGEGSTFAVRLPLAPPGEDLAGTVEARG